MKKSVLSRINYIWQNFIEDMFGMGNFSCPSYQNERKKVEKIDLSNCKITDYLLRIIIAELRANCGRLINTAKALSVVST